MGDLARYLTAALPDLVARLVQPLCVVTRTGVAAPVGRSSNGTCAAFPGSAIEFPPVHDMHIGVLSTSLGSRGVTGPGAVCVPGQTTPPFTNPPSPAIASHTDDRGELLNRTAGAIVAETEATSADMRGQSFLDWFPRGSGWAANDGKAPTSGPEALSPPATAIGDALRVESDFARIVSGVHPYGCGLVSPLESWYRFLVQPDPYDSIQVDSHGLATWSGVDATIVRQRHDFLRPDSLVLIVSVSDKDDQEIDVRSVGGQGYRFFDSTFQPPRGTASCTTRPDSPACTSCEYAGHGADPSCRMGPHSAPDDPGFDIGTRTIHMQEKYGLDAQFPIGRYVLGLTSPRVPDRFHEYPPGATSYAGGLGTDTEDLDCANPLFAASLPDGSALDPATLCNAKGEGGPRRPDGVFYAHIGGVPHDLLQTNPSDPNSPPKETLTGADWTKILGRGWATVPSPPWARPPGAFDLAGIDPRMIEAVAPRPGVAGDFVPAPHGLPRVEYACTFPLTTPIDCTKTDFVTREACDCAATGLPKDAVPSVCGLASPSMPYAPGTNDYTTQYAAKAYPSVREIELARLLGPQATLASLCPIHAADQAGGLDPLYGVRPALAAIVNRLAKRP